MKAKIKTIEKKITGLEAAQAFRKLLADRLERLDTMIAAFAPQLEDLEMTIKEMDDKALVQMKTNNMRPDLEELRYMAAIDDVIKKEME